MCVVRSVPVCVVRGVPVCVVRSVLHFGGVPCTERSLLGKEISGKMYITRDSRQFHIWRVVVMVIFNICPQCCLLHVCRAAGYMGMVCVCV